ncbi:unnamed protein product [Owenia fusiformis]|uniref:Uncharacterized protein n=1 Tax=Owenia fusiformis TaxID=6347 RepID=A0A8J1TCN9_OWEFU|nr:unnamed protein product [Owenia fusiformis]
MASSAMIMFWMTMMYIPLSSKMKAVSASYQYPDEPYINFTTETNHTCPQGCSTCSDMRYICTSLNVSTVLQTFPITVQYLQLTDIPSVLDIENNTFKRYASLRYLDISRNRIKSIVQGSLGGLWKLEYFKISQSGAIIYNYFQKSPRSLKDMDNKTLCDLKALKYLDMRGNNMMSLDRIVDRLIALTKACRNCTTDYLDLSYTNDVDVKNAQIQSYTLKKPKMAVFKKLNVKVLKLDGNHISSIEHGFGVLLNSVKYISLRANYIKVSFWQDGNIFFLVNFLIMYNLKVVDMGGNAYLPIKVSHPIHRRSNNMQIFPENLEEIYADNIALTKEFYFWDNDICMSTPNLKVLDMSNTIVAGLGASLLGLYNLKYLNFQNSRIIFTDPNALNCKNFPKLQTLLLGNVDFRPMYTQLNDTVSAFQNCSTIKSIDLENTNYADPQVNTFIDMENVRYINLSNNGIVSLDIDLHNNWNLKLLNLSSNRISQLPKLMMSQLDHTAKKAKENLTKLVVDLSFNPLLCGCGQQQFIEWMKTTRVKFYNFESYRCLGNTEYHLLHTLSIEETALMCKMTTIVSVSSSIGVMILLGILSLVIYAKRHRLEYLWLMTRQMARRTLQTKKQPDDYRIFNYHGFLSYSSNDDISIIVKIQEKIEEEFGLCLVIHQRDFIPGELINTNIIHFIEASRKVIILMSNNYLESRWCNFEFELSRNKRLDATYDTMVMILLHDLKDLNKDKISSSLKSYLGQETFLQWPKDSSQNPAFWLRLKEALDFGDVENGTDDDDGTDHTGSTQDNMIENQDEGYPGAELIQLDEPRDVNAFHYDGVMHDDVVVHHNDNSILMTVDAEVHIDDDIQPLL